jgi:hypothetical protein
MFKKISLGLLCANVLFSTALMADQQGFAPRNFPKNVAQVVPNPFGKKVTLRCTLTPNNESISLFFEGMGGAGSVNGHPMQGTDTYPLTLNPGTVLCLTADKSAKVKITNVGAQDVVTANCTILKEGETC